MQKLLAVVLVLASFGLSVPKAAVADILMIEDPKVTSDSSENYKVVIGRLETEAIILNGSRFVLAAEESATPTPAPAATVAPKLTPTPTPTVNKVTVTPTPDVKISPSPSPTEGPELLPTPTPDPSNSDDGDEDDEGEDDSDEALAGKGGKDEFETEIVKARFDFVGDEHLKCLSAERVKSFVEMLIALRKKVTDVMISGTKQSEECLRELKRALPHSRVVTATKGFPQINAVFEVTVRKHKKTAAKPGSKKVAEKSAAKPAATPTPKPSIFAKSNKGTNPFAAKLGLSGGAFKFNSGAKGFSFSSQKKTGQKLAAKSKPKTAKGEETSGLWIDSKQVTILSNGWFIAFVDKEKDVYFKYVDVIGRSTSGVVSAMTIRPGSNSVTEANVYDSLNLATGTDTKVSIYIPPAVAKPVPPKLWHGDGLVGLMKYTVLPEKYLVRPSVYLNLRRKVPTEEFWGNAALTLNHSPSSFAQNGFILEAFGGYKWYPHEEYPSWLEPGIGIRFAGFRINTNASIESFREEARRLPQTLLLVPINFSAPIEWEGIYGRPTVELSPLFVQGVGLDIAFSYSLVATYQLKPTLTLESMFRSNSIRFPLSTKKFAGIRSYEFYGGVTYGLW